MYKKRKVRNPLKYNTDDDQFLRVFVHILILFAQKMVAKMSELVQGAVRVCSEKGLGNEQK
jgi:hypothetical protein